MKKSFDSEELPLGQFFGVKTKNAGEKGGLLKHHTEGHDTHAVAELEQALAVVFIDKAGVRIAISGLQRTDEQRTAARVHFQESRGDGEPCSILGVFIGREKRTL